MKKNLYSVVFMLGLWLIVASDVIAQSVYAPLNPDYYHLVDRYALLFQARLPYFHTASKPYERKQIALMAAALLADTALKLNKTDRFNLEYLANDNQEWADTTAKTLRKPILKYFFSRKTDFYSYNDSTFDVHINPVLDLKGGLENGNRLFTNTRGLEVRGTIGRKVGFYTFMADNQALFPDYVTQQRDSSGALAGEGFWKTYGDSRKGSDFFHARGYLTFNPIKQTNLQFGYDRLFVGDGFRSMILSDFAAPYTFLRLNTKVWRLSYQNIFARMNAQTQISGDLQIPAKYFAFHHLNIQVFKNLNIGFFESVVFSRKDSLSNGNFDASYLNPIVFYRSIEQNVGSSDNALLGMDIKYNLLNRVSLYGQITLDEFLLKNIRAQNGWWANKYAIQAGAKYMNVLGLKNLDILAEYNMIRPFTYSHSKPANAYTHFGQPLAHPLGANLNEYIGMLRWQPLNRLSVNSRIIRTKYGQDNKNQNFGSNIVTLNGQNRVLEYNNEIGQGVSADQLFMDFTISYMLSHNLFFDIKQTMRNKKSIDPARSSNTSIFSLGMRWNAPQRLHEW